MCLEIVALIAADAHGRVSADRLSQLTGLAVTSRKWSGALALHFSASGGCSCDLLSDDAEFEAETWALESMRLPALAQAVEVLGKECKRFSFVAQWLNGETPRQTRALSRSALAELVRENRVGNNVLYVVS